MRISMESTGRISLDDPILATKYTVGGPLWGSDGLEKEEGGGH